MFQLNINKENEMSLPVTDELTRKRINSRAKGQRGEREVLHLIQSAINEVYSAAGLALVDMPKIERNLMQSMKGGHDLIGLDWIALEVKRVENQTPSNILSWWEQCKRQASAEVGGREREPVLFFRSSATVWSVRMFGYLMCADGARVRTPVDIGIEAFLPWFKRELMNDLRVVSV